ncbi:conjugal transfer protein TraG N-terminal domain-containing protein [Aquisalimonas lutea]|uniref:conjugal transfer protein TraG N-terminal domain-containing protein n=1 Tax=Aquisalimonas lutea TaxID=1327750 RepID=UPI0025B54082|nr:conjugal transfer protein TraG N-terminal domain-containing protein [Aquisalimonas lutea]MDN3519022.1 conjugal transfer protein TraG N-terminal domain-containing protein [Aquisalimonas lutea]
MNAQHPLELYTAIFGWLQYETIWTILVETGLAFIPFGLIIINAWTSAHQGTEAQAGSRKSVAEAEVGIALALSVVVLAGQPVLQLGTDVMSYSDPCGDLPDGEDTAYNDVFSTDLSEASVPIWWMGVMALGSGITGAAIDQIGCPGDLMQTRLEFERQRISDETVAEEVQRFAESCFVPARSKYLRERPDAAESLLDTYGRDETNYIGSRVFQDLGYYDEYRARAPVDGFPYDPARDTEYMSETAPDNGRPTCQQWWEGSAGGPSLRERILQQRDPGLWERVTDYVSTIGASEEEAEKEMIQTIISNEAQIPDSGPSDLVSTTAGDGQGAVSGTYAAIATGTGTAWHHATSHGPMVYTMRTLAPIIQSYLLMGIYILLPLMLLFSGYSWTSVFVASIAIISIQFWTYLWEVSVWLENHLLQAMLAPGAAHEFSLDPLGGISETQRKMIEMTTALLHMGLPFIFSLVIGWGGNKTLNHLGTQEVGTGSVRSVGESGESMMRGPATNAVTKGVGGAARPRG